MSATIRSYSGPIRFLLGILIFCAPLSWAEARRSDVVDESPAARLAQKVELDVDGDGDLDLVGKSTGTGSELELWINQGGNQWSNRGLIRTSIADAELLVADVNHDGCADLVISDRSFHSAPEIWNGRRDGFLEKGRLDVQASISSAGQSEARSAPAMHFFAMLNSQAYKHNSKAGTVASICNFQPHFPENFLTQRGQLFPLCTSPSVILDRSPPLIVLLIA